MQKFGEHEKICNAIANMQNLYSRFARPDGETPSRAFAFQNPHHRSITMRDLTAPAPARAGGELMSFSDLCRDLGRSAPWLRAVIADPSADFPEPITLGRRKFYRRSQFRAWLDAKASGSKEAA